MKKMVILGLHLVTALIVMAAPTLLSAAGVQLSWQSNAEPDLQGYNIYYGTESRAYGPPISVDNKTTHVISGLEGSRIYYFAVSAVDNSGNESGYSKEVAIQTSHDDGGGTPPDTTAPNVQITSPTSGDAFETDQGTLALSGQASDDNGIASVTWETDSGQSGTAKGSTAWSLDGIVLSEGQNVVTIHAFDPAGNEAVDQLTVQYSPADTTAPKVVIGKPSPSTGEQWVETTDSVLSVSGTATDDSYVTAVTWSINGIAGGSAAGTSSWSIAEVPLAEGLNTIAVEALDASGNKGSASLQVNYSAPDETDPIGTDLVSALSVASGRGYDVRENLADGNRAYIDRKYLYGNLPALLKGGTYILTANDDKTASTNSFLSFQVSKPVTVYVAHDDRITGKPAWMGHFSDTGADLSSDVRMSIFARTFPAGTVTLGGNGGTSKSSMYTVAVVAATVSPTLAISNVSASSGRDYDLRENLADGNRVYIDRTYTYSRLPAQLQGSAFILTANDDKTASGDSLLSFQVSKTATVYVAHDDRITTKPAWMAQFNDTGLNLKSDVTLSIYARSFPAGTVTLGGNGGTTGSSMYTVAIGE